MKTIAIILFVVTFGAQDSAFGQAIGSDMWTGFFKNNGLSSPHLNTCDSNSAFVAIAGSGTLGFCIEKDERSGQTWEEARETCAAAGKRLPELAEYKFSCNHPPSGLTNMTDDWEWGSNNGITLDSFNFVGPIIGSGNCHAIAYDYVGNNPANEGTHVFRCVS